MIKFIAGAAAAALIGGVTHAATIVTVEAAGVQNTTVAVPTAVETFDALTPGNQVPTSTAFASFGAPATFTSTSILVADQYGGAGGSGNQVAVRDTGDLSISFTTTLGYFGVWASALDASNTVSFYKGTTLLSSTNLTTFALDGSYNGNPTAPFFGQNPNEKYAFFNFSVSEGYDRVVLSQNGGGGFELDNVTIGGTVPEPATWALMIAGFGLVGVGMRRRNAAIA